MCSLFICFDTSYFVYIIFYLPLVYPSLASSCVILIFIKASQLFWSPSDTPLYNLEPCEPLLLTWHDFEAWQLLCCWTSHIWLAFMKTWANRQKRHEKKTYRHESERKGHWTENWEWICFRYLTGLTSDDVKGTTSSNPENENGFIFFRFSSARCGSQHQITEGKRKITNTCPKTMT